MSENTAAPAATRTVTPKYFRIGVNGNETFVKAKSRTAAIRAALEAQNVTVDVLSTDEILNAGLTIKSFIDATAVVEPEAAPAQ